MEAKCNCAARRRFLVVDDSVDTANMMKVLLRLEGYDARTAYDGGSALQVAGEFQPDVVVLNLALADMSGEEVAAALRKTQSSAVSLIIGVSGYQPDGVPAGFDHFLTKPLDHDALRELLAARGMSLVQPAAPSMSSR